MRFALTSACLFAFRSLSRSEPISQTPLPPSTVESDLTFFSQYKIVNCNSHWPARLHPEAKQLKEFLPQVWNSNEALLADITNGTNSKHGFGALFKSNASIRTVSSTIRNMRYSPNVGPRNDVPTMICLQSDSEDTVFRDLYGETCVGDTVAAAIPNSSYIGFCPSFFEINRRGLDFPIPMDCPVTTANGVRDAPRPLMQNTYPIFLAEMLRVHMEGGVIEGDPKNQVHHIQDCVDLNVTASLRNVANWANYAASVQASCEDWPAVPTT